MLLQALRDSAWPLDELLEGLSSATELEVAAHLKRVLSACHLEARGCQPVSHAPVAASASVSSRAVYRPAPLDRVGLF